MGIYVNPGNASFQNDVNSQIYVDKTGIIELLNQMVNTAQKFVCVSRARRFGKSVTAGMIEAYYSKGCSSKELFQGYEIATKKSFLTYLNQYDTIHIDMGEVWSDCGKKEDRFISFLTETILTELKEEYATVEISECETIAMALAKINNQLGVTFVIVMDEWDTVFREAKQNKKLQNDYVSLLRALFKSESAKRFVALAYITGILPIKKYGVESALNNFDEYTMLSPKIFARYFGFTGEEVQALCQQYDMDFDKMKEWYDGYSFKNAPHIYNPNSVVKAIRFDSFESYWSSTEAFSSLTGYISLNFEGLRDDIIRMFSGARCRVKVGNFENDFVSYKSKDDVMTALIHLGYLAYDLENRQAYIPNKEVQEAFEYAIEGAKWSEVVNAVEASEQLLRSTWQKDEDAVAKAMEKVHEEAASVLQYNDENSLSCAISLAFYNAKEYYTIMREAPFGKGYADLEFVPRKHKDVPAMILELKCDQTAEDAIAQIKERRYMDGMQEYKGNMLLVGIQYDKKTKEHHCKIEEW